MSTCGRPLAAITSAAWPTRSPPPRPRACPRSAYELQTLYGMGDLIQRALVDRGHRVRVYTPYGAILPGMAYLVRRLLENTSNESFLKASVAATRPDRRPVTRPRGDRIDADAQRAVPGPSPRQVPAGLPLLPPFHNEPPTDFARAENREAMRSALDEVRSQLGRRYPLLIGGQEIDTRIALLDSVNPGQSSRVVGQAALASVEHADAAVAAARAAFPGWAATPAGDRAADPGQSGGDHAQPAVRAGRVGDLRVRQTLGRGGCRHCRGHRLLRVLCPRDDPPGRAEAP